jgi:2-polyprenyl-3-methyl-5-hydroxy-6-metoxy-1,4-benzoquinol methylase
MPAFDRTKWDAKYSDPQFAPREPSAVLVSLEKFLPNEGRAIDVAGGAGRNAIWLAQRGLDVTIADVSSVGLAQAAARAAEAKVSLKTLCTDLEESPFPPGPWDLILSIRYVQRPLFKI